MQNQLKSRGWQFYFEKVDLKSTFPHGILHQPILTNRLKQHHPIHATFHTQWKSAQQRTARDGVATTLRHNFNKKETTTKQLRLHTQRSLYPQENVEQIHIYPMMYKHWILEKSVFLQLWLSVMWIPLVPNPLGGKCLALQNKFQWVTTDQNPNMYALFPLTVKRARDLCEVQDLRKEKGVQQKYNTSDTILTRMEFKACHHVLSVKGEHPHTCKSLLPLLRIYILTLYQPMGSFVYNLMFCSLDFCPYQINKSCNQAQFKICELLHC